jgi:hypothetical protein
MGTTATAGTTITGRTIAMDINIMATIASSGTTGGRTMDAGTTPGLATTGHIMDAGTTSGLATRSGCITTAAAIERERSGGDTGARGGERNCGALWWCVVSDVPVFERTRTHGVARRAPGL